MKRFDQAIRLILSIFALCAVSSFCKKQTDTFTIWGCASSRPYCADFATSMPESSELNEALTNSYTYFGRGGQAYAFFSEDGKYVIKFFKQRLFRPSLLLKLNPIPPVRNKRIAKRLDKWRRDFFSYKVASTTLQEETGVLYSHLNPTKHLQTKLKITDRLGIEHKIDLDQFDFIVQKRAERVYDRIDRLMAKENLEGAKQALAQVFTLIDTRAKKGYRDRDPNIRTNCGFIENKAVKIDVGRFVLSEEMKNPAFRREELKRIIEPFGEWIQSSHPLLLPELCRLRELYEIS
ncbi:MAG: hypothetical protein P0S96_04540 [Simkaniaceae bacterium]|nr:hypothetical protein [Candidatus Sacchlamyda saccharinae]